jgi:hypothetical protein
MDRFIEHNDDVDEDNWNFVFVDSIEDYYDEPSEAPIEHGSNPNSPFIGKTPQECYQLLLKLREDTESEIIPYMFAIIDERSIQDVAVRTVRATFQTSGISMVLYETGHSSVEEDAERAAREKDNVYRGVYSKIR